MSSSWSRQQKHSTQLVITACYRRSSGMRPGRGTNTQLHPISLLHSLSTRTEILIVSFLWELSLGSLTFFRATQATLRCRRSISSPDHLPARDTGEVLLFLVQLIKCGGEGWVWRRVWHGSVGWGLPSAVSLWFKDR